MVESVVSLETHLNIAGPSGFSDRNILVHLEIRVVESRTVEEVTLHIAERADRLLGKGIYIEPVVASASWIFCLIWKVDVFGTSGQFTKLN